MGNTTDIFIIGGGINGAGIARDAAGRGMRVVLAEKDDLASHTSSASSKLIHGGLRYLEHYEFRLVRESLIEREVLLNSAPHLIRPMRFILPHHKALRPRWMLRIGLFMYDHMGGRKLLPATKSLTLAKHPSGGVLSPNFTKAFEYSDCWVDDARLVLHAALDAAEHGATILTRTKVVGATRENGMWAITVKTAAGELVTYRASALVNAAGPWVDNVEDKASPPPKSKRAIRMVKGSHIIVPRLYEGGHAYTFQNADGRVVFAVPYENNFTLIGTTDVAYTGNPGDVAIDEIEKAYLCDIASQYFRTPVAVADIVWTYAGVRPLVDDGTANASKTTRDYVLELDTQEKAPMLSVYGGKITTFRCLAEEAILMLADYLDFHGKPWTARSPLPGGDMGYKGLPAFTADMRARFPWLPEALRTRMIRAYGTRLPAILDGKKSLTDMGQSFGAGLYEAELSHMKKAEWAQSADDALWRRSKLGLHMTAAEREAVCNWFGAS